jgi:hypothetical protein
LLKVSELKARFAAGLIAALLLNGQHPHLPKLSKSFRGARR